MMEFETFFCTNEHLRNGRRTETAQKSISESDAKRAEVLIYNSAQNISDFVLSKVLLQRLLDVEHYQQSSNIYKTSIVLRSASERDLWSLLILIKIVILPTFRTKTLSTDTSLGPTQTNSKPKTLRFGVANTKIE